MRALFPRSFCSCDSRRVSLWELSAGLRYTTRRLVQAKSMCSPHRMCQPNAGALCLGAPHRLLMSHADLGMTANLPAHLPSPSCLQERRRLLEVRGIKALCEPVVNLGQELSRLGAFALALPQATQARCRPQLERFRVLTAGPGGGLREKG